MTIAMVALFVAATGSSCLPHLEAVALTSALSLHAGASEGRLDALRIALTRLGVVGLATALIAALRGRLFSICAARLVGRLRDNVFSVLLNKPQSFHDEQGPGQLTSRLSSDCVRLGDVLSTDLSIFVRNLVQSIVSLSILLNLNSRLAIMVVLVAALRGWSTVFFSKIYRRLSKEQQDALASSSSVAEQSFLLIKLVRTHGSAAGERRRYNQQLDHLLQLKYSQANLYGASIVVNQFLDRVMLTGVLGLGSIFLAKGLITPEGLTSFLLYSNSVSNNLRSVAFQWGSTQIAFGAATRVFEFLRGPSAANTSIAETSLASVHSERHSVDAAKTAKQGALAFHSVDFVYPSRNETQVFEKLSLSVRAGERVAIVGESGCGKSTIFALALRLYRPMGGTVTLDGVPMDEVDENILRSSIAWVQQEPPLFPNVSISENIAYGLQDVPREEIEAAAKEANAFEFIQQLPEGFDTRIGAAGAALSGGQKQRIALARALVRKPVLLLLDEPTSALDPESERAVEAAILRASEGRTVMFTTHKLSQAQHADRIFMMSDGKIVEQGTHEELLRRSGAYARYLRGNMDVKEVPVEVNVTLSEVR